MSTFNQLKQKAYRKERIIIESKLHPFPVIGDIEILHEHKGKNIIFTAWKNDNPLNRKSVSVSRNQILYTDYGLSQESIDWLIS